MRQWRDAGVPLGCRTRDGRRGELLSMLRCRLRESGSGFDALAFDGAVHARLRVSEDHRPEGHRVVDELVAVDVPHVGARAPVGPWRVIASKETFP